jgi:3-hydroxyisobutyrate dehydrogenase-like beta-hydroxyacid dehydrogenase
VTTSVRLVLGFIGLGDMGRPMARRLIASGHDVIVWNRSLDKSCEIVGEGAILAASPADLMRRCDLVGLCVTSHEAVAAVATGIDGLFAGAEEGGRKYVADFSTGSPDAAGRLAGQAAEHGIGWVDSPVSGGVRAAEKGDLIAFLGGTADDVDALAPLLAPLVARSTHMGGPGAGQRTKICNQMVVACELLVIAETIAVARSAGVEVEKLPAAMKGGFADSVLMQIFGQRMAEHRFAPRLGAIQLMAKDLGLVLEMAEQTGAPAPISAFCNSLYHDASTLDRIGPEADLAALIGLYEAAPAAFDAKAGR